MLAAEPANAWLVLAKCAAGLMIVVALVVLVVSDERVLGGIAGTATNPPRAAAAGIDTEMHRRQMFDERRVRFHGNPGQHGVASEALEPVVLK